MDYEFIELPFGDFGDNCGSGESGDFGGDCGGGDCGGGDCGGGDCVGGDCGGSDCGDLMVNGLVVVTVLSVVLTRNCCPNFAVRTDNNVTGV